MGATSNNFTSSGIDNSSPYTNNTSSLSSTQQGNRNKANAKPEIIGCSAEKGGEGAAHVPLSASQKPQKIPENVKERIVELFATFHTHRQVAEIILEDYHIVINRNTLAIYDPERVACQLGKRLRRYYAEVRERYANSAKEVAMAHQAHRLRKLEDIADLAIRAKDFSSAIKALEVAAKEVGGLLEAGNNKLTVEHRGTVGHVHATVDEARKEVAMRLANLVETSPELRAKLAGQLPAPDDSIEELIEGEVIGEGEGA